MNGSSIFFTIIGSDEEKPFMKNMCESIRTFGGAMGDAPIWAFNANPQKVDCRNLADLQVQVFPLDLSGLTRRYPFRNVVLACAQAEEQACQDVKSLIYVGSDCLILQPPLLFDNGDDFDISVRPVHIRNVGMPLNESPDAFWQGIYKEIGTKDIHRSVTSFVDGQQLRAYYNFHAASVRPSKGLFRRWRDHFLKLVQNDAFQAAACEDQTHRIFLFQSVFCAIVSTVVNEERVRTLPPTYNYPLHLHAEVPDERRATSLNDLVLIAYEDRNLNPENIKDIEVHEPLRSWLKERFPKK